MDADSETLLALAGYRDAMTFVLQVADDDNLLIDEGLLKSLHFMMLSYDLTKNPGRWRPGAIHVRDDGSGEIMHEGPPFDRVPSLISASLEALAADDSPVMVKAAMAHLNLVMVHPYSDGNGRMARCLQTLVLARDRLLAPVFSSIEEFLGRNTQSYYDVLADVGRGSWKPENDARQWIRFCLRAHFIQAKILQRRRSEVEELYTGCLELASARGVPERCAAGLMDAAYGLRLRRGVYKALVESVEGEEISDIKASRDLRAMVDADLLVPTGERRARYYTAGGAVEGLRAKARRNRPPRSEDDPFRIVRERRQLTLG